MIIGISAKKQSGKDTVANIIRALIYNKDLPNDKSLDISKAMTSPNLDITGWQIKRFADKLKDIVCLLINCTREELEDNEFKETPLGQEWNRYLVKTPVLEMENITEYHNYYFNSEEEARNFMTSKDLDTDNFQAEYIGLEKLTPRLLLQLIDTECGRNIIHPNIWINATMADYKPISRGTYHAHRHGVGWRFLDIPNVPEGLRGTFTEDESSEHFFDILPNWIITDVRFPNEVKAIEDKGGVVVRINRSLEFRANIKWVKGEGYMRTAIPIDNHPSETSLDNYEFSNVINNNGTMEELITGVSAFLKHLKLI